MSDFRLSKLYLAHIRACHLVYQQSYLGANNFTMSYIEYPMVPTEQQTGFFYPVTTPIRILRLKQESLAFDPFAV